MDRGALTPNEWRETFNLAPVTDGDKPLRRLDTQTVNEIHELLNHMDLNNAEKTRRDILQLLKTGGEENFKAD